MAVDLPAGVKEELGRIAAVLAPVVPGARFVPVENLHCTLSFLGGVEAERVPVVSAAIAESVAGLVDFPSFLDGIGAFPSERRARVLWVGLGDPAGGLAVLAEAVLEGLDRTGFPRERRPFHAHVTLARLSSPSRVDLAAPAIDRSRFVVDRVTLFQSVLRGKSPPRYDPLATFPFRREASPPRPD